MKKKWSPGKKAGVICGSIAAVVVLLISFYISVFQLMRNILIISAENERYHREYEDNYDSYAYEEDNTADNEDEIKDSPYSYDEYEEISEYYEFHDAIRDDLSYWVEFENSTETFGENENIFLEIIYPVFYSDEAADMTGVNHAAQKELEALYDYVESVSDWIGEDEVFTFSAESYVTYMDEEILSIAYVEQGYLNGEVYENYVISVNIDMESKMPFTNSQLLNIDDDFSIEFRNRCERQNGEIESLYSYSDQDITELLTSDENLIIFYTPLGMEIGFNYYYGWVTVTYPDYQKYQRKF